MLKIDEGRQRHKQAWCRVKIYALAQRSKFLFANRDSKANNAAKRPAENTGATHSRTLERVFLPFQNRFSVGNNIPRKTATQNIPPPPPPPLSRVSQLNPAKIASLYHRSEENMRYRSTFWLLPNHISRFIVMITRWNECNTSGPLSNQNNIKWILFFARTWLPTQSEYRYTIKMCNFRFVK